MLGCGLKKNAGRMAFAGKEEEIASDIRRFQDLGGLQLAPSFHGAAGLAESREGMLRNMEGFANGVVPKF